MIEQNKNLRCFYAPSGLIYDKDHEENELTTIKMLFENVICAHDNFDDPSYGKGTYLPIVKWAEMVVVSAFRGYIGKGPYFEVMYALKNEISVMCLIDEELYNVIDAVKVESRRPGGRYAKLVIEE